MMSFSNASVWKWKKRYSLKFLSLFAIEELNVNKISRKSSGNIFLLYPVNLEQTVEEKNQAQIRKWNRFSFNLPLLWLSSILNVFQDFLSLTFCVFFRLPFPGSSLESYLWNLNDIWSVPHWTSVTTGNFAVNSNTSTNQSEEISFLFSIPIIIMWAGGCWWTALQQRKYFLKWKNC